MSALKAFLQPPVAGKTNKVIVSERFKGEDGQPVPFVLQAISQEKNCPDSQEKKKRSMAQ